MEALTLQAPSVPRRHWFVFAMCLFFLAINVQFVIKIVRTDRANSHADPNHPSYTAFQRWAYQIQELGTGVDIWEKHNFPNPPIMGLILKPLVHLPLMAASLIWFYLKIAMAIVSLHWVIKLLDPRAHPFPWWGKALTVLLCMRPIEGDLIHGNVNLFILFLVVGALFAFCKKRDLLAGVVLGLAIACKVTPALFVPYFLWKRAWTTLAGTALGVVLFVWVVPGAILGWGENQQYLENWYKNMVQPYAEGKVTSEAVNQSLPGFSYRMLMHKPSTIKWVDDVYTPVEYCNVLELDEKTVQWGLKGCMGLFALLVVWRCRTPLAERNNWRLMAEFSVIVVGMLLFNERTWKHHGVVLLLPFGVLAYALTALRWPPLTRWYLIGTLAAVVILITLTSTGLSESQDHLGERAQIYGAYVWAFLLLLAAMLVLVRHPTETADTPSRGMSAANPAGKAERYPRDSLRSSRGLPWEITIMSADPPPPSSSPESWPVLAALERRILGVMVEKAKTTPDTYPMSVNSVVTGCNQKSNRDPIMNVDEIDAEETLAGMQAKGLVIKITGSRVVRWRHHLYEKWHVNKVELALLAELLLRGAQTEGELRGRASRMEPLDDLEQLRQALRPLAERKLVLFLGAEGRRGTLIAHGFYSAPELDVLRSLGRAEETASPTAPTPRSDQLATMQAEIVHLQARMQQSEEAVQDLRRQIQTLKESLGG